MTGVDNFFVKLPIQKLFGGAQDVYRPDLWFQWELLTPNSLRERSNSMLELAFEKCLICMRWKCHRISDSDLRMINLTNFIQHHIIYSLLMTDQVYPFLSSPAEITNDL